MKRNSCSSRQQLIVRNELEGSGPNTHTYTRAEQKHSTPSDGLGLRLRLDSLTLFRFSLLYLDDLAVGGDLMHWLRQSEPASDWSLSERWTNHRTIRLCKAQICPGREVAMFTDSLKLIIQTKRVKLCTNYYN